MNITVKTIAKISILSAVSFIVMLFEFPLPFMPPFLKIDLSEVPVLTAAFAMGPLSGVLVEFIKNALHLMKTSTVGVGELANFLVGVSYVVPAGIIYKRHKTRKGAYAALTVGTLSMAVFASLFNYFVLLPVYASVLEWPLEGIVAMCTQVNSYITDVRSLIAFGILPFNLVKGVVVSVIVGLIYKKISPILHR